MSDIYKMKGEQVGRQLREYLESDWRKNGYNLERDKDLLDSCEKECALNCERSLRMKALNRRKKAENHAKTKDMFSDK